MVRVKVTRTGKNSSILDVDGTQDFLKMLQPIAEAATEFAARQLEREVLKTFADQGPGWPENAPQTVEDKGHGNILTGLTGFLEQNLTVRPTHPMLAPAQEGAERFVGWFGEPHPSTDGRLTDAQLMYLHEFADVLKVELEGDHPLPGRPVLTLTLSKVESQLHADWAVHTIRAMNAAIAGISGRVLSATKAAGPSLRGAAATQAGSSAFRSVFRGT